MALIAALVVVLLDWYSIENNLSLIMPVWDYRWTLYKPSTTHNAYVGKDICVYATERQYTKFGNWVKRVPGIVSLPILIFYYLLVWPVWVIYTGINLTVSFVIGLLFKPLIKDEY